MTGAAATALLAGFLGFALGVPHVASAGDGTASKEYAVKAAFIYNFAKFIQWPPSRFADAQAPIVLGAYCPETFAVEAGEVIRGRTINGRAMALQMLGPGDDLLSVHIAFFCTSEEARFRQLADSIAQTAVLTVGEADWFVEQGGMITFTPDQEQLRFAINLDAATRAGLKVGSQLQKLAIPIRRAP